MKTSELRKLFLDYFASQGHTIIPSSSLVPVRDPSVLLTTAGMQQLKPFFLGVAEPPSRRLTSVQKCFRTTDIDHVGHTSRHCTFFEMLGNFSVGDYFKEGAVRFALEFSTLHLGFQKDRLWISYFMGDDQVPADEEAMVAWEAVGIPRERMIGLPRSDNFWGPTGASGPCGPCSELYYDQGEAHGCGRPECRPGCECDRFLEYWNLVFMQYNRTQPDPEHSGQWDEPLPATGVDTGAGLERVVSAVQGAGTNYETDLFMPIIARVQELTGHSDAERDANIIPYRVIADHMRAATFLISDGVRPGATGRDYVCRMVIRRAVRFGSKLDFSGPFRAEVADAVSDTMRSAYPELDEAREPIRRTITSEEVRFRRAMDRALDELDAMLAELAESAKQTLNDLLAPMFGGGRPAPAAEPGDGDFAAQIAQIDRMLAASGAQTVLGGLVDRLGQDVKLSDIIDALAPGSDLRDTLTLAGQLPGDQAFRLHAEKGLPLEITRDIARERGFTVDEVGFRAAQKAHEAISRGTEGGAFGAIDMGTGRAGCWMFNSTERCRLLVRVLEGTIEEGTRIKAAISTTHRHSVAANHTGTSPSVRPPECSRQGCAPGRFIGAGRQVPF